MAAPMMTMDLPCVLSALSANWRATVMTWSRGTPVMLSLPMRGCVGGVCRQSFWRHCPDHGQCRTAQPANRTRLRPWHSALRRPCPGEGATAGTLARLTSPFCALAGKCGVDVAAKVREADVHDLVLLRTIFNHRELEFDIGITARLFVFQIPLAFVFAAGPHPSGNQ